MIFEFKTLPASRDHRGQLVTPEGYELVPPEEIRAGMNRADRLHDLHRPAGNGILYYSGAAQQWRTHATGTNTPIWWNVGNCYIRPIFRFEDLFLPPSET